MRRILPHVFSLVTVPGCAGQSAPQPTGLVLRSETRVVQIDVVVTDSHGQSVRGLAKEDFSVTDEGKPRVIQLFSASGTARQSGPPGVGPNAPGVFSNRKAPPSELDHSTIILLDGANGWFDNFAWARQGVIGMLDRIPADERIAIYAVAQRRGLVVMQDFTTDHRLLLRALNDYIPPGMRPAPPGSEPPGQGMHESPPIGSRLPEPPHLRPPDENLPKPDTQKPQEAQFLLDDSSENVRLSLKALAQGLSGLPGRKSVFWMTQGFPPRQMRRDGQLAWDNTVRSLNEANIAVNTVDTNGLDGPPRLWGYGEILTMQQIAEETGGKAYFNRNDLDGALVQGIEDSRGGYTLGFYLSDDQRDNKFHRLRVRVDRRGLELRYRRGYFAGDDPKLQSPAQPGSIDSMELGIHASANLTPGEPHATLKLSLNLDPEGISLKPEGGAWVGAVDETFLETNERGNVIAKVTDSRQFTIPQAARPGFDSEGIGWPQTIPIVQGTVTVTVIIHDSQSGHTGSLTVPMAGLVGSR